MSSIIYAEKCKVALFGVCNISLWVTVTWTSLWYVGSGARNKTQMNFNYVDQVLQDWQTKPFIDVVMVTGEEECPEDYENDVFYEIWPGAAIGCKVEDRDF